MRRRHPNIDHHELRLAVTNQGEQLRRIGGLAHHLETRPLQQAGQTLAQQNVVVGDDDLHGRHVGSFRRRDKRRRLNNLACEFTVKSASLQLAGIALSG